ncbi:interferon-induced protein 44-like isoform X1 [Tachysurus vachellii]|uniref:interferon-induced protein 44-like isoform X1 n=1 Tax=Tachysurus vachellii TaxID=175792 RepID=UPI00296AE5DA|nr:interferon-induced protein 44-like isoform X1 [Tachysurus vachellii]
MASIVSSLTSENEVKLQKFFSRHVQFHLLYKSSHHEAGFDQLLNRFDHHGKYAIMLFLKSGAVLGAFMSKPLKQGLKYSDDEAFVFKIEGYSAKRFPVSNNTKAITVTVGSDSISFGEGLNLNLINGSWYERCHLDTVYVIQLEVGNVCCVDVELHRVQDIDDILPNPWREVVWRDTTREDLRKSFVSYKLLLESLTQVKVLLLGPVASGKSSFINSVRSAMYKRVVHLPNVGTGFEGFTQKMTTYDIRVNPRGSPTVLSLCDVMPLGDDDSTGLSYADALAVIKGHIPEGYKFQRGVTVTDTVSDYVEKPTLKEKIHCVLFVLDASKVSLYPSSLESTLRKLRTTISDLGIPQLVLLTHVDQVCLAVQKDVMDVYSSRPVQEKMQKAATLVGLPLSYVLPVKNYLSTLTVDCNTDILLLSAVMNILQAVNDSFEDQYDFPVNLTPEDDRKIKL